MSINDDWFELENYYKETSQSVWYLYMKQKKLSWSINAKFFVRINLDVANFKFSFENGEKSLLEEKAQKLLINDVTLIAHYLFTWKIIMTAQCW